MLGPCSPPLPQKPRRNEATEDLYRLQLSWRPGMPIGASPLKEELDVTRRLGLAYFHMIDLKARPIASAAQGRWRPCDAQAGEAARRAVTTASDWLQPFDSDLANDCCDLKQSLAVFPANGWSTSEPGIRRTATPCEDAHRSRAIGRPHSAIATSRCRPIAEMKLPTDAGCGPKEWFLRSPRWCSRRSRR